MNFNQHSNLEGRHAFLSASKYHWVNYTPEKLDEAYLKYRAKELGTKLHAFAKQAIDLKIAMPLTEDTLYMYINDAIHYGLTPEQPLYYSNYAFGTADAIGFDEETSTLRIHDLKTGVTRVSMTQLEIYAALFCLEYMVSPYDINIILRIYQNNTITENIASPDRIRSVMDRIILFDERVKMLNQM